jgi:hypothetical protein
VEGRFILTRQAPHPSADLSDEAIRGVAQEPNADNTLLLYENPDLGIRLLHPRRWRLAGVHGRQVALDEAGGSGLLLTVEPPAQVPTGTQFHAESLGWLKQQKAKVLNAGRPQRLQPAPQELESFAFDVELPGQKVQMDYYVARQPLGGATIAARLLPADLAAVRKEVERMARSLTITRGLEVGTAGKGR